MLPVRMFRPMDLVAVQAACRVVVKPSSRPVVCPVDLVAQAVCWVAVKPRVPGHGCGGRTRGRCELGDLRAYDLRACGLRAYDCQDPLVALAWD